MGRIQALKGFAMHIKGFALYFNSNRKTLKSFKQEATQSYIPFRKVTLAAVWAVGGMTAPGRGARRPLRRLWQPSDGGS